MLNFTGVIPILATPFHDDESCDHESLARMIEFFAPLGIGGIWVAAFIWQLKDKPLLPLNDPEFQGGASHA